MKFKEFFGQRVNKDKWSDDPDEELSLRGGAADPHVPQPHYGNPLEPGDAERWLKNQKQKPQQPQQQQPAPGYDVSGAEEWKQKQNPTGTWDRFKTLTKATDDDNGIRALYGLYGKGWDSEDVIKRANATPMN